MHKLAKSFLRLQRIVGARLLLCLSFFIVPIAAGAGPYASIVIDASDGRILIAEDAYETRHPASLTKMMTLYLTFDSLKSGKLKLNQKLTVSSFASRQEPSSLGLRAGQRIEVEDAMLGVITKSANDASVVLAEAIAGSEQRFAQMMTQKARAMGMRSTVFQNASGLPDSDQVTTAHDMAVLALALIHHHPNYYRYFATSEFRYNSRVFGNHNRLMAQYQGMDGIKTGFIRASGFNLVASVIRNGRRLVGVVFGGSSPTARNARMADLLDEGFVMLQRGAPNTRQAMVNWPGGTRANPGTVTTVTASARPGSSPSTVPLDVPRPSYSFSPPANQASQSDDAEELPSMNDVAATVSGLAGQSDTASSPEASSGAGSFTSAVLASANAQSNAAPPLAAPSPQRPSVSGWGVQVGAFGREASAQQQALAAAAASRHLAGGSVMVAAAEDSMSPLFRARVLGLSENAARQACVDLRRQNFPCLILTP